MNKKEKLIPKLRFPEFFNDGEWSLKKLNSLAVRVSKKNKDEAVTNVFTNSANEGIVEQSGYFDRQIVNKANIESYYIVENNDYVYNPRISKTAPVGPTSKNKTGIAGVMSPLYTVFRFKNEKNNFFEYYFQCNHWFSEIRKASNTGARFDRVSIKTADLMDIGVLAPKPLEQQKIASCLSSIDELIEVQSKKLEILLDHWKGLMQNIFPQEGKNIAKYRFPEFKNDKKWEYLNGNELFEPISNKNHNSDLPVLAITQEQGAVPRELINYTVIASKQSISSYKVVEIGNFIISLRSFQGGIEYSNYKGICSPAYIILRKKKKLYDLFYKYYFKSELYILQLNKNLEGIRDGKMVSYSQFSEIKLPFPSFKEQQKIASSLSVIDDLISNQKEKIEQLKDHRKGLMQSLFPNNF